MHKLSVVIITYNEEKNIGRCLESVQSVADEILIVDSFSTDQTKQVSEMYNVKFIQHPFEGHIQQKNYAASQASYDYVLSLDADETLSKDLQASILKEKMIFSKDGYFMNRMTSYLGKWIRHGSWYPDRKMRLWNRHKGKWGGQNPHDKFELFGGNTAGYLKGDILHYTYNSIEEHVAQFDKFTTISATQMQKEGKRATYVHIFFSPIVSFIKGFFIRLGFLDGFYGIVLCIVNSFATFIKYVKLRELNKNK